MYIFTYNNYINYLKHKDEIEKVKKELEGKYKKQKNECCANYQNGEVEANIKNKQKEEKTQGNILHEKSQEYVTPNGKLDNNDINIDNKDTYINNKLDKVFRKILDDKQEASKLINKALKLKNKLTPKDIEKYNSSFVTNELKNEESDIIYKLKDKNVFFLIEHQTKVDYSMTFRILEYQVEIIKSAINLKYKNKKEYKFPIVIPIVLYTGKKKWNSKASFKEIQEILEGYEGIQIGTYNIVDVNDYTEEELLKEDSFLTKAMLIEKAVHSKNLEEYLKKIVEVINRQDGIYTKEQKELLKTIMTLVLGTKLDDNLKQELIKELNEREEKNMLAVLDMLEKENKKLLRQGRIQGRIQGRKEGIKETAKKMLQKKIDVETVMEITGLTEREIIKISQKCS